MRGRLVLFFLAAVLLPVGLGTVVSELLIERQVADLAAVAGRDSVEPMLARLKDSGTSAHKALVQLAQRADIADAFVLRDPATLGEGLRAMNAVQHLDFVHAVDGRGTLLASTDPPAADHPPATVAVLRAARAGRGGVSYEELSDGPEKILVQLVAVPVRRGAEAVGVLLGGTRLSDNTSFAALLAEGTSAGALIAHRGTWVAAAGQPQAAQLVGRPLGRAQQAALEGRRAWFGPTLRGDAAVTALVPLVSASGEVVGGLGARVDVSELGAVRGSARRAFLLALGVGGLLCILLARLVARRTLAPLERLVRAASDMERGRLDAPIAAEGDDEVVQLGRALQRTAAALRESMATLETRVEERTREIEAARDREHALNQELARRNEDLTLQGKEMERQRRQLEDRTRRGEEADRLKNVFIANMSHEIRTPLNSVLALSQLLRDGMAGNVTPEQRRYMEVIERNGQNLLRLINDILDLSRIEAGYLEMELQATDLGSLIRTAAGELAPLADAKGLDLVVKLPETLPLCRCDPDRVRQVLTNLIGNAIKFTPQGHVQLSAEARNGMLAVHVADTGIGIPESAKPRLFEEFFQVDQTLVRRSGGTGLGLAIASRLVRIMGGELTVESVVGAGSRFTFTLPRSEGAVAGVPEAGEGADAGLKGEVLLVDGDDGERRRLAALLGGAGLDVQVAASVAEALARMRTTSYHVVVLDLGLAGRGSFDAIVEAHRSQAMADTPVLVLAPEGLDPSERERLGPPVVGVVRKTEMLPGALLASLRKILAGRSAAAARPPTPPPPRDVTVLVVEDNEDNLFTLRQILTPLGLEVAVVASGREAIEYCRSRLPDLILMDVQMPGMSGLQATGAIRGLPGGMTIPIVALTAQAMKGDRERILSAGCDEYLSKPIQPKLLTATVQRLLSRREPESSGAAGAAGGRPPAVGDGDVRRN
jgi:signal transduction histidine kinase/CheY-like chemotaxis protein